MAPVTPFPKKLTDICMGSASKLARNPSCYASRVFRAVFRVQRRMPCRTVAYVSYVVWCATLVLRHGSSLKAMVALWESYCAAFVCLLCPFGSFEALPLLADTMLLAAHGGTSGNGSAAFAFPRCRFPSSCVLRMAWRGMACAWHGFCFAIFVCNKFLPFVRYLQSFTE